MNRLIATLVAAINRGNNAGQDMGTVEAALASAREITRGRC
jgi:hypothetical protein